MDKEQVKLIGAKVRKALAGKVFSPIIPKEFHSHKPLLLDLSYKNPTAEKLDMSTPKALREYVAGEIAKAGTSWAHGGYDEKRTLYATSPVFQTSGEPRSVHFGLDIWVPAGTELRAPISGKVHSFQDNNNFLDYGPTIILEHEIDGVTFYTLYGHLSRKSLDTLHEGKVIEAGELVAHLGDESENGSWAPHLHLQIIGDMLGKKGDFPAIATDEDREFYVTLCPDPTQILGVPEN